MGQGRTDERRMKPVRASLRMAALLPIVAVGVTGTPERLSPLPPPALAATSLVCSSVNWGYSYCRVKTGNGVKLVQQLSSAPCVQGRTWGTDPNGIWVDRGCAAQFQISTGPSTGTVVGAVIIGGIVGALLGGSGSSGNRYSGSSSAPSRRSYYNNTSPAPYDQRGRYTGCHGIGCTVDNPDAPPEPGQGQFRGGRSSDSPPEPGQTEFRGGRSNDDPPEPGQSEFSGDTPD